MKKKLLSLALALALCLSLTAPALASGYPYIIDDTGNIWDLNEEEPKGSGHGWTWDVHYLTGGTGTTLTLDGFNGTTIWTNDPTNIVLAPGSKNTVQYLTACYADVKISGSGELIISGETSEDFPSPASCTDATLTLNDGLVMTGGASASDNLPLTFNSKGFPATADGTVAKYVRIAPKGAEPTKTGFTDVAANSPYAEAIEWAVGQKIANGKTATTFAPGETCTIRHILTFLWRANGRPGDNGNERASVTAWANKLGLKDVESNACTRSTAVYYLWTAAGKPEPKATASFSDVSANASYAKAVSWAVEQGVTTGTTATAFSPERDCTRGQIVTFLYRSQY